MRTTKRRIGRIWGMAGAMVVAGAAAPAAAGPFDDQFFVRAEATATAMLSDREACAKEALGLDIDASRGFSNPDYGVLTAMGSALQQDGGDAKVRKAVRRVVLIKCMERRGWVEAVVIKDDLKGLKKAASRNPAALEAWLIAHQPKPEPAKTAAPVSDPAAPASIPAQTSGPAPSAAPTSTPTSTPTPPAPH